MRTLKVQIKTAQYSMWYNTMINEEVEVVQTSKIYYKYKLKPKKIIFKCDAVEVN